MANSLVSGHTDVTLNDSAVLYVDVLERADSARRVIDHVLGQGLDGLAEWTPQRGAASALATVESDRFQPPNLLHESAALLEAAAWQLAIDPSVSDPIAPRALDVTRRYAAEPSLDRFRAEHQRERLRHAEQLVEIANLDLDGRQLAMRALAVANLAARGLAVG